MELEKTPNNQHIIEEEEKVGGLTLFDFRTYYKATVIQEVWNRQID